MLVTCIKTYYSHTLLTAFATLGDTTIKAQQTLMMYSSQNLLVALNQNNYNHGSN